jgi:hypothetical protein
MLDKTYAERPEFGCRVRHEPVPVRQGNRAAFWEVLVCGDISTVGTDLGLPEATQQQLLEQVRAFDSVRLSEVFGAGGSKAFAGLIFGVADHDVYHAGQNRLFLTLEGAAA